MSDPLTEHLAAIRRIRAERLEELMRDLEEGRLNSSSGRDTSEAGAHEAPSEISPTSPDPAR